MLQKTKMVMKKALESMYNGKCTVTEYQEYQKPNKSTGFREVPVLEDIPCRLSFQNITSTKSSETASAVSQVVKLFCSPSYDIKAGSKITVAQNNQVTDYKCSGIPAVYESHQEIILELFDGWS